MSNVDQVSRDAVLRPRRQLTLPAGVCATLGLETGDRLEVSVTDDGLLLKPKKGLALRALREIQRAFASAGISEEELQAEGRSVRERLSRSRYAES